MDRYKIFLSHNAAEAPVARSLKEFIERIFAGAVEVFVSTHEWSLRPGDIWEAKIRQELGDSKMMFVLLSQDSVTRPWVNFEAGAAWIKGIVLIPMLHRGLAPRYLDRPFSSHQAISLLASDGVTSLIKRIATESCLKPVVSDEQCLRLVQEIHSLDRQIDEGIAMQCLPKQARSSVRFYLYIKSRVQYRQVLLEAGDIPLSCFRKPEIHEVLEAIANFGQPDTTVISLDEHWVRELARIGKLEELSGFAVDHAFFEELLPSGTYNGKIWSVPHFLDFSYYACHKEQQDLLKQWLHELSTTKTLASHLNKLRDTSNTDRLLFYDFHTPDTVACVVLEFIASFGDGVESLQSRATVVSKRNIRALKILRGMVGKRPASDFLRGEPLVLDSECEGIPFLRGWHSEMTDYLVSRETHMPMQVCPIMGTLGGWHIGILANSPSVADGLQGLAKLLTLENQQERLRLGGGLPALDKFYHSADLARQRDPITGWSLAEIGVLVKSLIRRSRIPHYPVFRTELCELHDQIMSAGEDSVEEMLTLWAEKLAEH